MAMQNRALWLATSIAIVLSSTRNAVSEPSPADKSLATELFQEGRSLVEQGRVSEGCQKLEESQRLDPGGGTLLNVALCHEKEGRTATAWAEFTEALGIAKRDGRAQRIELAEAHIASLEPVLSHLVVQVPAASDLPDLEVRRDGSLIRRAAWGSSMPVDPGDHLVEVMAPGRLPYKQSVTVGPRADNKTLNIPVLELVPAAPSKLPAAIETRPPAVEVRSASAKTPAGWVAVGIGATAIGFGTYFGLHAISLGHASDQGCANGCSEQAVHDNNDAMRSANLSTAAFGVGIFGVGLGTWLLLTDHSSVAASSPAVSAAMSFGPSGSTVAVKGRF